MDPISIGLLAALAGGVGGELGRQAWAGLSALVRQPFRRGRDGADAPQVSTGELELAALSRAPDDQARARALSAALAARSALDPDFGARLRQWHEGARLIPEEDGGVHNSISGGNQYGPVLQGRDFSGLSFSTPPPPPAAPEGGTPAAR
ncbi:hypothetical protein SSP531S_15710 [Streptomyces spongiicola]|uniref:Uncharacterized protein n=1 Tax=Streptomyces spongiicola TaxID=1690221 RepID=A0A2S1Z8S8_9ACTN|nr:hypothetical protein [Streptomyces spongiicola]AWK12740.1 hypothetical protein DDQ41_06070 [Streptomyces spongiicola]GBQ00161.1 hypothetical protein SSP531S_15710 [Streptomyces spongiicola]